MTARVKWLLFGSLALNLLIVGMILGWIISPDGPRRDERPVRSVLAAPFAQALAPQDRRRLGREMLDRVARSADTRAALDARLKRLLAALRAETWDREAVERVLADQRRAAAARQLTGEGLLLDLLSEMTPEERRDYAERLEDRVRRPRR